MTLEETLAVLRRLAPEETALPEDPVGLLLGREAEDVTRIGICLDATPRAAARAVEAGVHLVVAHHPLIYTPLKRIDGSPVSQAIKTLLRADIALYACTPTGTWLPAASTIRWRSAWSWKMSSRSERMAKRPCPGSAA